MKILQVQALLLLRALFSSPHHLALVSASRVFLSLETVSVKAAVNHLCILFPAVNLGTHPVSGSWAGLN